MNILLVHNYYQQPGGEDIAFANEARLLESRGHRVTTYQLHNDAIHGLTRLELALTTIWSRQAYGEIRRLISHNDIRIAHFHNTLPLVSPSAYYAARREGVPVVQTLHNFRLLCPSANFFRAGENCELCLNRVFPFPAIRHACYRQSLSASTVLSGMLWAHRLMGTYQNAVSAYIVLTEFARRKFVSGGLPARKLFVKPNCLFTDPGPGAGVGDFVLFAGRLSPEKGVATLLAAWKLLDGIRLTIAGDGPLAPIVAAEAARNPKNIEWLGRVGPERVRELMGEARCVVLPSECYEGLPFAIVEAFSRGTPVIATGQGSMPWLIDPGTNGLLFEPRSPSDLAAKVQAVYRDHARIPVMRARARQEFEAKYTAEANCRRMIEIYDYVLREQSQPSSFDGPEDRDLSPPSGFAGQAAGNCASKAEE